MVCFTPLCLEHPPNILPTPPPLQFSVQWKFYFVPDDSDTPPYTPDPKTPFNVTTGSTFYYHNATSGLSNMREVHFARPHPPVRNPPPSCPLRACVHL